MAFPYISSLTIDYDLTVKGNVYTNTINEYSAGTGITIDGVLIRDNELVFTERADHSYTPAATRGILWVKNDSPNTLIFTDDAGTDHDLTASNSLSVGGSVGDVQYNDGASGLTGTANFKYSEANSYLKLIRPVTSDTMVSGLILYTHVSTSTGGTGLGSSIQFNLEDANSNEQFAGYAGFLWEDASNGAEDSRLVINGSYNGVSTQFLFLSPGQGLNFNGVSLNLGISTTTGTSRYINTIGTETNIDIDLVPKGTGTITVPAGYENNITADEDLINKAYADANYGGSGGVSISGTPSNGQVAIWTGASTVEGTALLTLDDVNNRLIVYESNGGNPFNMQIGTERINLYYDNTRSIFDFSPTSVGGTGTVAYRFDTLSSYTSADKLVAIKNNTSTKFTIDHDGTVTLASGADYSIDGTVVMSESSGTAVIPNDLNTVGRIYTVYRTEDSPSTTETIVTDAPKGSSYLVHVFSYNFNGPVAVECSSAIISVYVNSYSTSYCQIHTKTIGTNAGVTFSSANPSSTDLDITVTSMDSGYDYKIVALRLT